MQYLLITILLFILELVYFKIADKFNIIDKPNERSSHSDITLRGGGIIFYIGILAFFIVSGFQYPYFFVGITLISIISFLDDILTLSNKIRIVIQFISILLMFYQAQLLGFPLWIIILSLIVGVGIINAYNFMDGINGITVSNSLAVLLLLAITNYEIKFAEADLIYYSIISCLVFGFFNFRQKAKCFAGDVGSVSIAFIILFLMALLIVKTQNIIYILFLTVYGVDSILTIIRRIMKKENIFEAHRSHLYQILVNENQSNKLMIASFYGILQFLIGLIIIFSTKYSFEIQILISSLILVICGSVYLILKKSLIRKYKIQ